MSVSEQLLEIFKHGVSSVQPNNILDNFIKVKSKKIIVTEGSKQKIYSKINRVFPVCIGKASVDMAKKIKKIFKVSNFKIEKGILIVNKENFSKVKGFKCFSSGHPIPNRNGLDASIFLENYLGKLEKNDLVLIFISGGGSALAPYPVDGISLEEKIIINKILLESGANIKEINIVRKHLSKLKGGNLVKICNPAYVHSFILSDVIGDDLSSIASGMTTYDNSTFRDVKKILNKYKIWTKIPKNIKNHINNGEKKKELETPEKNNKIFRKTNNTLIGSNNLCLNNMKNLCKKYNINSKIWFKNIDGDVKKISKKFSNNIKKIKYKTPVLLISGGETTVKVNGKGKGGRNQEFALYFAIEMKKINPSKSFIILSAGTDGRDGPTNAAGGILNQGSLEKIKNKKVNLKKELLNNNSYQVLKKINSLVIIEGTNTNVADVQLIYLF
jgi:hydroxypyruvate reductase